MTDMFVTRMSEIVAFLVATDTRVTRMSTIVVYSEHAPIPPVPPPPPPPPPNPLVNTDNPVTKYNRRPAPVLYQKGWVDHETGNLQRAINSVAVSGPDISLGTYTPTLILTGETFIVPVNKQVLFSLPILVDGTLIVDGDLIQVD